LRRVVVGMALLALSAPRLGTAVQFNADVYDEIKPSVIRVSCSNKAATGFLWSSPDTAVTALHVVAGCDKISAYYESLKVSRPAKVIKVLRRADLVLLKISDAPNARALVVDPTPPALTDHLSTLGYPLQIMSMSSTSLQLRYGGKTLRNIVPDSVAQSLSGGSPSLDLEIDSIEGHLLPGHSGAPIFNQQRKIVAIADGGLENGAAALSWGIPAHFLNQLANSDEHPETTVAAAAPGHAVLFSAETESRNLGETTCSGATLTKLRSATFAQLYKSVDDPAGLLQTIQTIKIDPSNITFDVYQHLTSGATFVLPTGAELKQDANGDCVASLPSGKVRLHIQVGILSSPLEVQAKSLAFERDLVDGNTQGWIPDQQWTNFIPLTRFDGLLVRRRGYQHVKMFPMFQDKYLFEVLAMRNNVFIGSAALQQTTLQWNQKIAVCNTAPNAPQCADVLQYAADLVKAMLGVQLTTFPVG
jgi:Trypsin-like peptidase domain